MREIASDRDDGRERIEREIADLDRRIEMQVEAIEAGVDAALVSKRIDKLKKERRELERVLASTEQERHDNGLVDFDDACKLLDSLPRLDVALAEAGPELRRGVFDGFRLSAAIDRNAGQIRLKALVSSAFGKAGDLQELVANGSIAGAGFGHLSATGCRITEVRDLPEPSSKGQRGDASGTAPPGCSVYLSAADPT